VSALAWLQTVSRADADTALATVYAAEPWAVNRQVVVELAGHGLDRTAVQAATQWPRCSTT